MKRLLYILLFAGIIIIPSKPVVAQNENKNLTVALSKPSQPGNLKVELMNGSIKVTAHSGKDVIIGYSGRGDDNDSKRDRQNDAAANGLRRIPNNSFGLEASEENNRVVVRTNSFNKEMDLNIKVPRDFSVKLSTLNGGKIIVEGVNGEMEISNLNDDIRLTDVSGSVVANTLNGDLQVSLRKINPNVPMAFSTMNGKIDVALPANAKFATKMKADNGEIYSDFEMNFNKDGKEKDLVKVSGGKSIKLDKWLYGSVNGGGPEFMFKNFNGNIYIRKIK
ncbi:DUF4097 family beta strand repeat-containing protein [Adhaeribacter radiodurans]|uniref:DUF4097 family beta strand repeat protein n=1 Tax=Adhaeribacter radiodurans TaxID=2745197 RepID=A0A7L7LEE7_9BACT|nr:DUF4097 family beta strand repeat-containing protein [Adhaeribacter radiodurans]QMU31191.1 DUF4097 family beta strand repeat protein [Adhaeribacter radiodurans]